ncbi:hypothetical protein EDC04DRAFT_2827759 [Pisolithus marmoratus]|nr:hypothetical protein EDC04DRAFT_2827759 [Pisolithus marmoratus]
MAEELRRICAGSTWRCCHPYLGNQRDQKCWCRGSRPNAVVGFLLSKGMPKKWIETADLTVKK